MRKEKVTPQGQPRAGKADEQRDGGTGTKGRHGAQQGGEEIGADAVEPPQDPAAPLRRKVALDIGDEEDQGAEQDGDLDGVVQEKLDASTQTPVQGKTRRGEPGPDDLIEPLHPQDLVLNELPQLQGESLAFIKYIKKF